jgi:hypothetical protein
MSDDLTKQHATGGLDLSAAVSVPFWGDDPGSWDTVSFTLPNSATVHQMPGLARVSGHVALHRDKVSSPGKIGVRSTLLGYRPAEVDLLVRLWTAEHLRAFEKIAKYIRPLPGVAHQPIQVGHPALSLYSIGAVIVIEATLPEIVSEGDEIYEVKIRCEEFIEPAQRARGIVSTPVMAIPNIAHAYSTTSVQPVTPPTAPSQGKGMLLP